jgi:hypothetical protein
MFIKKYKDSLNYLNKMEEPLKRGRKKKPVEEKQVEDQIPKKRGRKKKWETTSFKNNVVIEPSDTIKFDNCPKEIDSSLYNTNKVKFGNLFINVHDKDTNSTNETLFTDTKKSECLLTLSSDDEEKVNTTLTKKKSINVYSRETSNQKKKCFNCHHFFENTIYYLPYNYCQELDRYKIYGNFCSPNCVKSYCINSKEFQNKMYLVGQFYRTLFGSNFRIKPAPSILTLKDYGGTLTIEEFRESFYNNSRYTLNNINSKIIKHEITYL